MFHVHRVITVVCTLKHILMPPLCVCGETGCYPNYPGTGVVRGAFFFFKQKTAYESVSGDWSSDVCSSDLAGGSPAGPPPARRRYDHGSDPNTNTASEIGRASCRERVSDTVSISGVAGS